MWQWNVWKGRQIYCLVPEMKESASGLFWKWRMDKQYLSWKKVCLCYLENEKYIQLLKVSEFRLSWKWKIYMTREKMKDIMSLFVLIMRKSPIAWENTSIGNVENKKKILSAWKWVKMNNVHKVWEKIKDKGRKCVWLVLKINHLHDVWKKIRENERKWVLFGLKMNTLHNVWEKINEKNEPGLSWK